MRNVPIRYIKSLMFMALIFLMTACNSDDGPEEVIEPGTFPGVDERLWPFFSRFEDQARLRGIEINLAQSGVTGAIIEIDEDDVAGTCNFNSRRPNHVTIDQSFWDFAPFLIREFVVFHELGHCELFRDHKEDQNEHGFCISIMRSGSQGCRDNYSNDTRPGYLDELFDPAFANDLINGN